MFNRIDNNGKTISDRIDCFRSEKIRKELTREFGLYFAFEKEKVKENRLWEPDKMKYEIKRKFWYISKRSASISGKLIANKICLKLSKNKRRLAGINFFHISHLKIYGWSLLFYKLKIELNRKFHLDSQLFLIAFQTKIN